METGVQDNLPSGVLVRRNYKQRTEKEEPNTSPNSASWEAKLRIWQLYGI